jgi:hypothetical protein
MPGTSRFVGLSRRAVTCLSRKEGSHESSWRPAEVCLRQRLFALAVR